MLQFIGRSGLPMTTAQVSISPIQFFGSSFNLDEWKKVQHQLDILFSEGSWVNAYSIEHFKPMYYHQCLWVTPFLLKYVLNDCYESEVHRGYRWYWKPQHHHLKAWSPETMCRLANGRNIMFAGDSLNEQMFYILLSSMMSHIMIPMEQVNNTDFINAKRKEVVDRCENFCPYGSPRCNGPVRMDCGNFPSFEVSFYRDDHLKLYSDDAKTAFNPWMRAIETNNISLLVLSTGSHFLSTPETIANINESIFYIKNHIDTKRIAAHKVSMVYRNTAPGHPHCKDYFRSAPLSVAMNTSVMAAEKPHYHWWDIPDQNVEVSAMLSSEYPDILQLDIYSATVLRADSHPLFNNDCLHYCMPGPADEWVLFLYNALLRTTGLAAAAAARHTTGGGGDSSGIVANTATSTSTSVDLTVDDRVHTGMHHIHQHEHLLSYINAFSKFQREGIVVDVNEFPSVYLIQNGSKHHVYNVSTLESIGKTSKDVVRVDKWEFIDIPVGKPLYIPYA